MIGLKIMYGQSVVLTVKCRVIEYVSTLSPIAPFVLATLFDHP